MQFLLLHSSVAENVFVYFLISMIIKLFHDAAELR